MRPISRKTTVILGSGLVLVAVFLYQVHLIESVFLNPMTALHNRSDRFENRIGSALDEFDGVFDKFDGLVEQLDVLNAKADDLVVRTARIEGFLDGLSKRAAFPHNRDVSPATPVLPQD